MKQLSLFNSDKIAESAVFNPFKLCFTDEIVKAFQEGCTLLISVSGGKDSDAMTWVLKETIRLNGWQVTVQLIHADLGRMEHPQTPAYIESFVKRTGYDVLIASRRRADGEREDLLQQMQRRHAEGKIPFPSINQQWCTSDNKRGPLDRLVTPYEGTVIVAMGLRADESNRRKAHPVTRLRPSKKPTKTRVTYDWLPIHTWTTEEVWHTINSIGDGKFHPMYDADKTFSKVANQRLSCAMCFLASLNDLINGAHNNPDTYRDIVDVELDSEFSYQQGRWLASVAPDLLTDEQQQRFAEIQNRAE